MHCDASNVMTGCPNQRGFPLIDRYKGFGNIPPVNMYPSREKAYVCPPVHTHIGSAFVVVSPSLMLQCCCCLGPGIITPRGGPSPQQQQQQQQHTTWSSYKSVRAFVQGHLSAAFSATRSAIAPKGLSNPISCLIKAI